MVHSGDGVWKELVDSQSSPMGGYKAEIWNSPSIGSRISTSWRMAGQRAGSPAGSTRCSRCGMMDHGDGSDVPTVQGEE